MMPLSTNDRIRLFELLGMLGSSYDGEVLNAARAAQRLVVKCGETWESVIAGVKGAPHQSQYREPPHKPSPDHSYRKYEPSPHQAEIKKCLERPNLLSEWERQFLQDIFARGSLSEKQRNILERIKEKIAAYADMTW